AFPPDAGRCKISNPHLGFFVSLPDWLCKDGGQLPVASMLQQGPSHRRCAAPYRLPFPLWRGYTVFPIRYAYLPSVDTKGNRSNNRMRTKGRQFFPYPIQKYKI